jgi:hypothetical protein
MKYAWLMPWEKGEHGDNTCVHVGWMRDEIMAALSLVLLCKTQVTPPDICYITRHPHLRKRNVYEDEGLDEKCVKMR